jgi:transcriptional regulator with XRE-family HTH domain
MSTPATRKGLPASPAKSPRAAARPGTAATARTKPASIGWRRTEGDQSVNEELGTRVRALRERRGLSLAQLSEKSGLPGATLSRIENHKMSPTFGVLSRVMEGLEADWIDLVGPAVLGPGERLVSFVDPGKGHSTTRVRESRATVLHSHDAAHALPLLIEIDARELAEVGGLIGHRGEEFCYVLSGTMVLHIDGQPARIMKAGASVLFDSSIPHAYLSGGKRVAKALLVVVRDANPRLREGVAPKA